MTTLILCMTSNNANWGLSLRIRVTRVDEKYTAFWYFIRCVKSMDNVCSLVLKKRMIFIINVM